MLVYSNTINSFLKLIKTSIKEIMINEMGFKVYKQRFEYNGLLYPLNPVCFEHPKVLGFFEPHSYQIGINRNLLGNADQEFIKNILRHELCHLFLFINNITDEIHGPKFREAARSFGWDDNVYLATTEVGAEKFHREKTSEKEIKLLKKVQKLLKLSESNNIYEAQMATAKANQILLEHNLTFINESENDEGEAFVARVLYAKRNSQKLKNIYEILKKFFVQPVFSYSQKGVFLEIIGEKIHVELADYVAKFLSNEFERLWKLERQNNPQLKGTRSKNSFFTGVTSGFLEKIQSEQISTRNNSKEIIQLKNKLSKKVEMVYGRLGSSSESKPKQCLEALKRGQTVGRSLSINKALNKNNSQKQISYQ